MFYCILMKCFDVNVSAVHLSVIHCQRTAAENLLSVLSTLPDNMAVNDRNDLLQVNSYVLLCCHQFTQSFVFICY